LAIPLLLLVGTIYILVTPWAATWQDWLAHKQWENYDLRFYGNSVYGNIAVTQRESQYTFYENGLPILTAPVPDIVLAEDLAHLPLLFQEKPQQVLVVSGGVGGVLTEILKHPVTRVDYAELDPLLITTVQRFPTSLTSAELSDPGVTIYYRDGRLVIKEKAWELQAHPEEQYQVILVNLPYPSTLQLNRFYTKEFFLLARQIMADDGILAMALPGSLTYMGPELRALNATLETTLRAVFPQVRPIPGDTSLFLASPAANLVAVTPEMVLQRAQERCAFGPTWGTPMYCLRTDPAEVARTWRAVMRRGSLSTAEEVTGPKDETIRRWRRAAAPKAEAITQVLVHDRHRSEVEVDSKDPKGGVGPRWGCLRPRALWWLGPLGPQRWCVGHVNAPTARRALYPRAIRRTYRDGQRTGKRGRLPLVPTSGMGLTQAVKRRRRGRVEVRWVLGEFIRCMRSD